MSLEGLDRLVNASLCWPSKGTQHSLNDTPPPCLPQYFPVQFNKGEHGYDNQEMDMKPFFRAVGPAFHSNLLVEPFETVDIYPLMCHILGIRPEVNDGNLNNVRQMLVTSPRTDGRAADGEFTVLFKPCGLAGPPLGPAESEVRNCTKTNILDLKF